MEGLKSVSEAIASDIDIDIVLVSDSFMSKKTDFCAKLDQIDIPFFITSDHNLVKCSNLKTPQGIIAAVHTPNYKFEDVAKGEKPLVILDGISDPGNLGTIIRSADAFNFGGVLLLPGCADAYSPKTVQSTMGSILRIKCIEIGVDNLDELKSLGFNLFGMDLSGSDISDECFSNSKTAVAIGSESRGLSNQVLEKCTKKLKIPMYGGAESLNAAIASGIVLHKVSDEINSN